MGRRQPTSFRPRDGRTPIRCNVHPSSCLFLSFCDTLVRYNLVTKVFAVHPIPWAISLRMGTKGPYLFDSKSMFRQPYDTERRLLSEVKQWNDKSCLIEEV